MHDTTTCTNNPDCGECAEVEYGTTVLTQFQLLADAVAAAGLALDRAARVPAVLDEHDAATNLDPSPYAVADVRASLDVIHRSLRDLHRIAATEQARIREYL